MVPEQTVLNGRYKLLARAGSGGMAAVYKAQDLMLRRLVAVKLLHESLTGDEEFLHRFQQEAHAAANLSHPNIVTVHDIGQDDGPNGYRHYIVMEYVKGQTLKELIRQQMERSDSPLPVAQALDLVIQIASGLGYAHRAGLVHCDVKPQNVLVAPDGRVKVADFGIARAMSQGSLHAASQMWGTPHYFSPEQASGEPATPASDVYSIGIILFEMLTGRLPFEADTLPALALKHMHETPPPVTQFNPVVPVQLERIVGKVLSKEPAGRYRTAGQLERILRSYRESSVQDTGPIVLPPTPEAEQSFSEQATQVFRREPASPFAASSPAEHPTEIFRRPTFTRGTDLEVPGTREPEAIHITVPNQEESETDRTLIALAAVALVAMLGLLPLWYAVARAWGVW